MRAKLIAALLVIVPSWLMLPLQSSIHAESVRLKYGGAHVTRQMRDAIGQGMAIALLAGFRGVVADFLWIQSHDYWEKKQWLQQYRDMEVVTTLQPQSILFWDEGSWHMAWNIGYAVSVDTNNVTAAQGIKRERAWHERAREFLARGLENIPNRYELYFKMGWLYLHKLVYDCGDDLACKKARYCEAAEYLRKAASYHDAPSFVGRTYARALEDCGDIGAAYQQWVDMWKQGPPMNQPSSILEREIRRLEDQFNMPDNERVFPKRPAKAPSTS
ncbi:MAG TPA: hypothetical protein VLZ12_10730 [Verrucomicrobiae bacterium]|nr:hypothetical protein [Verrucomicrobiae bacterium]